MEQTQAPERAPLTCEQTHKLLGRVDTQGLWLWCRNCHREHLILWENIPIPKEAAESAYLLSALIGH